jgi:hypothetical protein
LSVSLATVATMPASASAARSAKKTTMIGPF